MILFPNAKINLGLNITGRRSDGYHNLESIFIPVGWKDVLEIVPGRGAESTLTVYGRQPECKPEDNLVMKAYRALSGILPSPLPPVDIYLEKIIPEGAGLGGGSSDAAFTLHGLNAIFNLNLSDSELAEIASTLGADCPFFIYNLPMLATGIGTTFSRLSSKLPACHIVIAKPDLFISTKEAYAGVTPHGWAVPLEALYEQNRFEEIINDFEASVGIAHPEIEEIKQCLRKNGAFFASMSGSGSAVYGLFDSEENAIAAESQLKNSCQTFRGTI